MRTAATRSDPILVYGLAAWRGRVLSVSRSHQHREVEINIFEGGAARYILGGTSVSVREGQFMMFWAAVPHHITDSDSSTILSWITIPLVRVLQWGLPDELIHNLLLGRPILEENPDRAGLDIVLVRQWLDDLRNDDPAYQTIVFLEIEARLRRLSVMSTNPPRGQSEQTSVLTTKPTRPHAEEMAHYMAQHYTEPLQIPDVARLVGLHPNYAMQIFRHTFGMTMIDYLTQQRIVAAQRLLAITERRVTDIAIDVGFGSLSRFYEAFQKVCGQAPGAYRNTMRQLPTRHP